MSKAMSLKARIRNMAKQKNITAQVILQNYMFERFLERLSLSAYKDKFVLKGGMLIAAIVGLDTRSTMDLDATLRLFPCDEANILAVMHDISGISIGDDVRFTVKGIVPIRHDDVYGGFRVGLEAVYDTIVTPLSIDISAGDVITPHAVRFSFAGLFDETKRIELWAYNIETIIAEKVETILRRGVFNTRLRDFYDVCILLKTQNVNRALFAQALQTSASHRGTLEQIADTYGIINALSRSVVLKQMWDKYRQEFGYAKDIRYEDVISALKDICHK
ncbi:MAG: nucleotidyl transferase AbiEii/AbiGii toxin family protein [Actinomycetota bacterium]|nr:nucleotidyl transferase AbiEii/AbiGii toxin family protein [Actinomycetota bacterium]